MLHFCYLTEALALEEALNLLNHRVVKVSDSDSREEFSLPKETCHFKFGIL